jgi:hypothetical protein
MFIIKKIEDSHYINCFASCSFYLNTVSGTYPTSACIDVSWH